MLYNHLPKEPGVYMIYNYKTKRMYIGFSINVFRRFQDGHLPYLRNNHHQVPLMQEDWNNDSSGFICSLIELTTDKLREIYWINYYHSDTLGYNIKVGAKFDSVTKQKVSNALKGRKLSAEHKQHLKENHYNKNHGMPMEVRNKISDANKGKIPWNKRGV